MIGGYSAAGFRTGHRLSRAVFGRRLISATGVRRESRRIQSTVRSVSRTALCGRGGEVCGNDLPGVAVQAGGWQVQHDAAHRGLDPGAEFHEVLAQGADLSGSEGGARGARGAQTQILVQHVSSRAQQTLQLSGEEAQLVRWISSPCANRDDICHTFRFAFSLCRR